MSITPKDWGSFQHYKGRRPPWIKLHRTLLDDYDFNCLPLASRALAPCLWLLASEYEGGEITATRDELAFRFRITKKELEQALSPLIEKGFFVASAMLADCKQDAIPETETETERETNKRSFSDEFDKDFWTAYPNKVGKPDAKKAFITARFHHSLETILRGLDRYKRQKPPERNWLNPATFIRQERFSDQPAANVPTQNNGVDRGPDSWAAKRPEYVKKHGAEAFKVYCSEREKQ